MDLKDMTPREIVARYRKVEKPLVYQEKMLELLDALEMLEQDGKRLDWLDKQVSVSDVCSHLDWDFNTADSLRQAIDAAMARGTWE